MIKNFLFIIFHLVVFSSIIVGLFLGFFPDRYLAALAAAFSLEAVMAVVYFRISLKRTAVLTKGLQGQVRALAEGEDSERIHRELLYLGHQIKTLQSQIDSMKKVGFIKINGNGHPKGAHL